MITIYHNPRCSKSRATLELIRQQGQEPTIVEYLKEPLSASTVKSLLKQLGIDARDLLRTKEDAYKSAGLNDTDLSDDTIIAAMIEHPKLIERPIVSDGKRAVLGRPPENVLELLA